MDEQSVHIPLVEEELAIGKRRKDAGRVRVQTSTHVVQEHATVSLDRSDIEVERVPVGREIVEAPEVRIEGDTTIVPVLEEIVVVEKRLVLKEELRIRRLKTSETVDIPITLRKQVATIERSEKNNPKTTKEKNDDGSA